MLNKFIKTSSISSSSTASSSSLTSSAFSFTSHNYYCNTTTTANNNNNNIFKNTLYTSSCNINHLINNNNNYLTCNISSPSYPLALNRTIIEMEPTPTPTSSININNATSLLEALSLKKDLASSSASPLSSSPKKQQQQQNNNKQQQKKNNSNNTSATSSPTLGSITKERLQEVYDEFKLLEKDVQPFQAVDPLNDGNTIQGVVVKQSNDFIIMRVNNVDLSKYQYVHVAPKLKKYQPSLLPDTSFKSYYLANKWNGMNIQFFKYFDENGKVFVSARPRVSYFISNDKKSNTLQVVQDILSSSSSSDSSTLLESLKLNESCRSIVFELCGSRVPHIVKYDFSATLQPLFEISTNGKVKPIIVTPTTPSSIGLGLVESESPMTIRDLSSIVGKIKAELYETNKKFRLERSLSENMYWYNHFLEEGRVLYILDENGNQLVNDSILSIKPQDTDKFHWEQFDSGIQTKVLMIAQELREKGDIVDKQSLRRELELDEYSWNKWEEDIMDLAILPEFNSGCVKKDNKKDKSSPSPSPSQPQSQSQQSTPMKHMIITVGYPASGKSYFAQKLSENGRWKRVNQDEMGTRKKCEDTAIAQLKAGESVIVDRCNFDISQRRVWIKLAHMYGVSKVHVLWFKPDVETCKKRIVVRENHPTIPKGDEGVQIIDKFQSMFIAPSTVEGFNDIKLIQTEEESNLAIQQYIQLLNGLRGGGRGEVEEVKVQVGESIITNDTTTITTTTTTMTITAAE